MIGRLRKMRENQAVLKPIGNAASKARGSTAICSSQSIVELDQLSQTSKLHLRMTAARYCLAVGREIPISFIISLYE
jgi:hypothetical protein